MDSAGNAYVTGNTNSADFPTRNALYPNFGGGPSAAFIVKLNASGTALVYSIYLGGGSGRYGDTGYSIAVDNAGNVYVTGVAGSADFPTRNALYPNLRGVFDAFITKLNADGTTLLYSTYFGGSNGDWGYGIAVDGAGNAYVTGQTISPDFPTRNALYPNWGSSYDAFIVKLDSGGTSLVYSTYLGGNDTDYGNGIAVDGAGNAYVTGITSSSDFPTYNALYPNLRGFWDVFIAKLNAGGTALVYSTYLGGSSYDEGTGIAVDGAGNTYVTGATGSTDFPTHNALYPNYGGSNLDAFITKLGASGTTLFYSTYLGGSGQDRGYGIAVDSASNAYVTGQTIWPISPPAMRCIRISGCGMPSSPRLRMRVAPRPPSR